MNHTKSIPTNFTAPVLLFHWSDAPVSRATRNSATRSAKYQDGSSSHAVMPVKRLPAGRAPAFPRFVWWDYLMPSGCGLMPSEVATAGASFTMPHVQPHSNLLCSSASSGVAQQLTVVLVAGEGALVPFEYVQGGVEKSAGAPRGSRGGRRARRTGR